MRVEYLLPAIALLLVAGACSNDSGNVMAPNADPLEPALIEAALGPEPGSAPDPNTVAGNEATEAAATNVGAETTAARNEPAAPNDAGARSEPAPEGASNAATEEDEPVE